MLEHDLVLKCDELYLVGNANADGSGEPASGLYLRDTRYLDRFEVRLNGEPLHDLSVRALGPATALVVGANTLFSVDGERANEADGEAIVRPLTVSVEQHIRLTTDLQVRFVVQNYDGQTLPLTLSIDVGADLRDLFDIRGFPRHSRAGSFSPVAIGDGSIAFAYVDAGGETAMTVVHFDRPLVETASGVGRDWPEDVLDVLLPGYDAFAVESAPLPSPAVTVAFPMLLAAGETWELTVTVSPLSPESTSPGRTQRPPDRAAQVAAEVSTDNPFFNQVLSRAATDLAMLQTSFPEGSLPAAGVPWFVAPFGRDSLIVGLQTLYLAPGRAAETLRVLAALQGTTEESFREEEPGKILHEVRYGEMARLGEIPHTPYYGTVDATPLFILLFAETVAWSGDDQLYADLLPNVERALEWIEWYGDLDGDGLVEYRTRSVDGKYIVHQSWKDSHDSLHYHDGRPALGVIAPVEVQGYLYAAYQSLAGVVARRGQTEWAAELQGRAEAVRRAVEERFWLDEAGYYAQALDGNKEQVAAISSNPGHLLYCGLPNQARAEAVAARMRQPDLDSGWGIRTLSSAMPTYNPMSYHNGSVWPHDNSLAAAGLRRYGLVDDANRIASALFAVAAADPLTRLPELYCGFARTDTAARVAPVAYPVSCSPQAWAAAASQLLVRAMLGLTFDEAHGVLGVEPALPDWLNEITIRDLTVRGLPASLTVRRHAGDYLVETEGPVQARTAQLVR